MNDVEPTVTLRTGAVVLEGVRWMVDYLHAKGHAITIEDETISVDPPCHEDSLFILQSNLQDTTAVLADLLDALMQ